jgi:hypothetical protein
MGSANRKTRRCAYRKKHSKANRKGLAFARKRKSSRRSRRLSRRQRGGSYLEALSRPFFASVYPNTLQTAYGDWTGAQPNNYPGPPPPENKGAEHSWNYIAHGTPMNPDMITKINTGFTLMAGPTPYAPNQLTAPGGGVSAGVASSAGALAASAAAATAASRVAQTSVLANMAAGTQRTQTH